MTTGLYPDFSTIQSVCGIVPREPEALQKDFRTLAANNPHLFGKETIEDFPAWFEENKERFAAYETLYLYCQNVESLPIELVHYFPHIKQLKLENLQKPDERVGEWKELTSLDLRRCPLQTLPTSIVSLTRLTNLEADWNWVDVSKEILYSKNDALYNEKHIVEARHKDDIFGRIIMGMYVLLCVAIAVSMILILAGVSAPPLLFVGVALFVTALAGMALSLIISCSAWKLHQLYTDSRPRLG